MTFRDSWLPNIVVGVFFYLLPKKKELTRLLFRRPTRSGKVDKSIPITPNTVEPPPPSTESAVAMAASSCIRPIIVLEQPYSNPAPMVAQMFAQGSSGSIGSADLRGVRSPDDGRLDFLFDDDDGEYEYLPDMFGMFRDNGALNA